MSIKRNPSRAFFERVKMGICPSCGKKGLGPVKTSEPPNLRLIRSCRYCVVDYDAHSALRPDPTHVPTKCPISPVQTDDRSDV